MEGEKVKLRHVGETAFLDYETMEGVKEYYESKWFESQPRKIPEWDVARVCPSLELAQCERKLVEAEMRLNDKRRELDNRRRDMDQQWEDLKAEEQLLKSSFIKFNGFIVENMQKRLRAEKKMEDEIHLQETRLDDIMEMRQKVVSVRDVKEMMEEAMDSHLVYREFVQEVADVSDRFRDIHDVLGYFARLIQNYRQYTDLYRNQGKHVLKKTLEFEEFVEKCAQKMESLDIELQQCQARSEETKYEVRRARGLYLHLKEMLRDLDDQERKVRIMAAKMYPLVPQKGDTPNKLPSPDDIRSQLGFIRDGMIDMDTIIRLSILVLNREHVPSPEKPKKKVRRRRTKTVVKPPSPEEEDVTESEPEPPPVHPKASMSAAPGTAVAPKPPEELPHEEE